MKSISKITLYLFLFIIFSGFYSCSPLKVISDVNERADFKQYKTYRWANTVQSLNKNYPQFDNMINRQRIQDAIEISMERQGFTLVKDDVVDLEVDYHLQFKHNEVNYHNLDYDEEGYYNKIQTTNEIYQYEEGTLTIHLIDLNQKQLVWQGILSRVLDISKLKNAETEINKNVAKLFKKFSTQISE